MLRTLEPISRPMSQQALMKLSTAPQQAAPTASSAGSSTSTSTSDCGKSSPRP